MPRLHRMDHRVRAHLLLVLLALLTSLALAADRPFDRQAFEAAQKSGQPVLVAVHADWCTTCRAQAPIVAALLAQPPYASFASFRVDYDRQKDVLRQLRVQHQSTLLVFKDGREVARGTAVTDPAGIEKLLRQAL